MKKTSHKAIFFILSAYYKNILWCSFCILLWSTTANSKLQYNNNNNCAVLHCHCVHIITKKKLLCSMTTTIASQSYTRLRFSLNNFYGSARVSHEQIYLIEQNLKPCNRPLPNTEQDQQLSLRGQVSIFPCFHINCSCGAFYTGKGKLNFVLLFYPWTIQKCPTSIMQCNSLTFIPLDPTHLRF